MCSIRATRIDATGEWGGGRKTLRSDGDGCGIRLADSLPSGALAATILLPPCVIESGARLAHAFPDMD